MSRFSCLAHRFAGDTRGGIAVIFGLSLLVLLCCGALALDSSRVYNVNTKIQAALDAAALAGAKQLDADDYDEARIEQAAQAIFDAHTQKIRVDNVTLSNFKAEANLQDRTVETKVKVRMRSIFGSVAGLNDRIEFEPTAITKHVQRKIEVALVLDITGSMCAPGVAPCTSGPKIDALKAAAKELVDTLYSSLPEPGAVKVSLVPYSASVNVGASILQDTAAYSGAIDTCVMEREGIDTYTNALPVNGSLFETTSNTPDRPGYSCPASLITPLTDLSTLASRNAFKDQIDALMASGATAGHIGLAWGWYTLSPEWNPIWPSINEPKPYRQDVTKVVILMTDGEFNRAYWNSAGNTPSADIDPLISGSSAYQALQLCDNIKDRVAEPYGPTIYTISFLAPASADALMQQCSGAGNAYTAENRADLIAAFTDIVERLTSLAITN